LLDETVMSVKEVAATLGYDDPFYFSRVFKAVNNVSPSLYRVSRLNDREPIENSRRPLVLAKETLIPA
jgi:AraC-like DNA-binding protein